MQGGPLVPRVEGRRTPRRPQAPRPPGRQRAASLAVYGGRIDSGNAVTVSRRPPSPVDNVSQPVAWLPVHGHGQPAAPPRPLRPPRPPVHLVCLSAIAGRTSTGRWHGRVRAVQVAGRRAACPSKSGHAPARLPPLAAPPTPLRRFVLQTARFFARPKDSSVARHKVLPTWVAGKARPGLRPSALCLTGI